MADSTPASVSVSRLQKYTKCAKSYEYYYLKKLRFSETSDALQIGTIVHHCLEKFYLKETDHPSTELNRWWEEYFKEHDKGDLYDELQEVGEMLRHLLWRASEQCTNALSIRNRDGTVPKNPYMNSAFKKELEKLNLNDRRDNVDRIMQGSGQWPAGVSLVNVFSETHAMLDDYQDIANYQSTLAVEFPYSKIRTDESGSWIMDVDGQPSMENAVQLPLSKDWFIGFVDLIVQMRDGVAIIDHKTSSGEAPDMVTVMHHDQLLMYAWAFYKLFREKPSYIGINHLRSGTCVLAPVNWNYVEEAVARFDTANLATKGGYYPKRAPFEYQSPCLNGAKSIDVVNRCCPYLGECYPHLQEMITEMKQQAY